MVGKEREKGNIKKKKKFVQASSRAQSISLCMVKRSGPSIRSSPSP